MPPARTLYSLPLEVQIPRPITPNIVKSFTAEQSYYLQAPPEEAFRAVADPKVLVRWFLSKAELTPKRGGDYSFDWIWGVSHEGKGQAV